MSNNVLQNIFDNQTMCVLSLSFDFIFFYIKNCNKEETPYLSYKYVKLHLEILLIL